MLLAIGQRLGKKLGMVSRLEYHSLTVTTTGLTHFWGLTNFWGS